MNKFKYVNDTYGYGKGDQLLLLYSGALREVFESEGFVARMGGDEFVIILLNTTQDQIRALWEKLNGILREKSAQLEFHYVITASCGSATRGKGDKSSLMQLMQRADEQMYAQKHKREA